MTGIIDVGGGLRGVYGSGVLDRCMDEGIGFDALIGVSAGSANVATFAAGQRGRTYRFYRQYTFRKEYMSFQNLLRGKHFLDLDYVYGGLSNEGMEDPFGFDTFFDFKGQVKIVATDAETGKPVYFDNSAFRRNDLTVLKASSCLPFVCGSYQMNGITCLDGGIADPIPLKAAFDMGCDKVAVILTLPKTQQKEQGIDTLAAHLMQHKYPMAARAVAERYRTYNEALAFALRMEAEGRALIIAPDNTCGMKTLTKDKEKTEALYQKGYRDGEALIAFAGASSGR